MKLSLPRPARNSGARPPLPLKGAGPNPKDPLASMPLFASLSPEERARVRKKLTQRAVGERKLLFKVGETADALYVIHSGRFRLFVRDRFNQERVLQFLGPGEVLGEAAFMADTSHVTNAEAVEPSRVGRLARADFDQLLGNHQPVLRYLAGVIAQRQLQMNARLAAESTPEESRAERGFVTAVFSPRGGAGVTTLALALGLALAERHPDEVVLLDLDMLFGHAPSYLWLQPKGTLAQIPIHSMDQLDRRGLDYYLLPHSSSLRVFPGAQRPEEGEQATGDLIRAAVRTLRRHFGHLVLDLPHGFSEVALTGLELADRIIVVGTPELTTLRDIVETRRIYAELLALPEEKFHYILNHPFPYTGVPISDFAAATGVPWEEVAYGGDGPAQAALRGEALPRTRPGNPVSKMAVKLAELVSKEAREAAALAVR